MPRTKSPPPKSSKSPKPPDEPPQLPKSLLPYDVFTRTALLSIVHAALAQVAARGLPGEHHFFITFRTTHSQCDIPAQLRKKYPDEMTIVLQNKFFDLQVQKTDFQVGLEFGGKPQRLKIAFDAVTGFFDPAVEFGLRFDPISADTPAVMPSKGKGSRASKAKRPRGRPRKDAATPKGETQAEKNVIDMDAFAQKKG